MAFGLQRSGLYYTMVNTHLAAEEAAYIVDDCGARTLITSAALAPLADELVARTPGRRAAPDDRRPPSPPGHTSYDEFVAGSPGEPLADEVEGSAMLYSSGTTGHPKGIRRPLTGAALRLRRRPLRHARRDHGLRPGGRVPQPGPAVPLRPAGVVHDGPAHGRHGRGHGALRPRALPGPHRAAQGHARPVRPDHVRAHAQAARRRAGQVRPVVAALGRARRGALRARGQAADDRVVGAGHPRVLLGHRRHGHDLDHRRGGADAPRLGGQGHLGRGARLRRRRRGPPGGRRRRRLLRRAHRGRHVPVQPRPREDAPDLQRQGLGHAVGRRPPRRRGLPVPDRPQALHDRLGRREHLPPGDRGRPGAAPRGGRRRRLRRPRSRNGGGGQGGRPARPRRRARARSSRPRSSPSAGPTCPTTSARARSTSPTCCPAARTASSTRRPCARPTGPARPPAPPEPRAASARRRTRPGRGRRRRRTAARW